MGIGKRLKEAREKAGLTQEELGKRIGVTGSAITNYEKETSHPKEPVMYALMDALQVEPNFLFQDCINSLKGDKKDDFSEEEVIHIKKYRTLDRHGKDMVNIVLEKEIERIKEEGQTQHPKPVEISKRSMIRAAARGGGVSEIEEIYLDELPESEPIP